VDQKKLELIIRFTFWETNLFVWSYCWSKKSFANKISANLDHRDECKKETFVVKTFNSWFQLNFTTPANLNSNLKVFLATCITYAQLLSPFLIKKIFGEHPMVNMDVFTNCKGVLLRNICWMIKIS